MAPLFMRLVRCHAIIMTMSELVNNTRLHVGNKAPSVRATKFHHSTQYLRSTLPTPFGLICCMIVWLDTI
jgi:hypothetical protein